MRALRLLALSCAIFANAQEGSLQPGLAVEFTLGATLHTVHGTFSLKKKQIQFDPATGSISGEIVLDAASGTTGNSGRDHKMHGQVLESQRFPEIVFRPARIEGKVDPQGDSHVRLHGIVQLHGADHPVAIPLDVRATGGQYSVEGHFAVPYVAWGLKNPSTLVLRVSDKVEVNLRGVVSVNSIH